LATAQKSLTYIGVKIWDLKVQPFYVFKKKTILTRVNYMLSKVFLIIIMNLSDGTH